MNKQEHILRSTRPAPLSHEEQVVLWSAISKRTTASAQLLRVLGRMQIKKRKLVAVLFAASLFGGGVATVYASQRATPEDLLFPIDRSIEQVQLALASQEKKEELRVQFGQERLDEIKQIVERRVVEQKISPSASSESNIATSSNDEISLRAEEHEKIFLEAIKLVEEDEDGSEKQEVKERLAHIKQDIIRYQRDYRAQDEERERLATTTEVVIPLPVVEVRTFAKVFERKKKEKDGDDRTTIITPPRIDRDLTVPAQQVFSTTTYSDRFRAEWKRGVGGSERKKSQVKREEKVDGEGRRGAPLGQEKNSSGESEIKTASPQTVVPQLQSDEGNESKQSSTTDIIGETIHSDSIAPISGQATTSPQISGISVQVEDDHVTVSWGTDIPTLAVVHIGTSTEQVISKALLKKNDTDLRNIHRVEFEHLEPGTYWAIVVATMREGGEEVVGAPVAFTVATHE